MLAAATQSVTATTVAIGGAHLKRSQNKKKKKLNKKNNDLPNQCLN